MVQVRIWDAINRQLLTTFQHNDFVVGAIWSRDETRLLSWAEDNTVRMWGFRTGDLILTLELNDWSDGVRWNADEAKVVTWDWSGIVQIWTVDFAELYTMAQASKTRELTPEERERFFLPVGTPVVESD